MPNSLKCRLKGLVRKGLLSEKDLSRIYTDNDVIAELEKIRGKFQKHLKESIKDSLDYTVGIAKGIEIIDERISELKGE